ncbi:peptidase inhibitor family I36 protein [Streptomyces sp. NPDC017979]|uniref:peptidase inhibitor family I36 protein n=1 Tax=Streptomyces sp. NPDC017979 TaxID=3365024 RepID=UPI0037A316D5
MGAASLSLCAAGLTFAPSAAAGSDRGCPEGHFCVWDNGTYSGPPTWKSTTGLYDLPESTGISFVNNTSVDVRFKIIIDLEEQDGWLIPCLSSLPGRNAHAWNDRYERSLSWTKIGETC